MRFPQRRYNDYERVKTDDCIIISDIEIPDHRVLLLKLAMLVGLRRGIRNLAIGGDVVATDQQALNAFVTTLLDAGDLGYNETIQMTRHILAEFLKWFENIWIIEGNHDDRISRATGGQINLGMFLDLPNVTYSRYDFMYLDTSRGPIRIAHPSRHYSGNPAQLGQQLYNVTAEKSHWVIAHCHRDQFSYSPDGSWEIHALGTGRDLERTKYKATKTSKNNQWDNSFLVVQDGFIESMSLKRTNWKRELGPLYDPALFLDLD